MAGGVSGFGGPKLPTIEQTRTKGPEASAPAGAQVQEAQTDDGIGGWLSNAADKTWSFTKDVARGKYGMAGMSEADKALAQKKLDEKLAGGGNLLNPLGGLVGAVESGKKAYEAMQNGDNKTALAFGGMMFVEVGTGGKGGKVMRAAKPLLEFAEPVTKFLNGHKAGLAGAITKLAHSPSIAALTDFAKEHGTSFKELLTNPNTPDSVKTALAAVRDFGSKFREGVEVLSGLRNSPALRGDAEELARKITSGQAIGSRELSQTMAKLDGEIAKTAVGSPTRAELEAVKGRLGKMTGEVEALEKANSAVGPSVSSMRDSVDPLGAYKEAEKVTLGMGSDALKQHQEVLSGMATKIEGALKSLPSPHEGVSNFSEAAGQVGTLKAQLESSLSKVKQKMGVVDQQVGSLERKAASAAEAQATAQAGQAQKAALEAQQAAAAKATKAGVDVAKAEVAPATKRMSLVAETEGNRLGSGFRGLDDAKNKARVIDAEAKVEQEFASVSSAIEKASASAGPEAKAALQVELKAAKAQRDAFHQKAASERHELDMPRTDHSGPVGKPPVPSTAEPLSKQFKTPQAQGRVTFEGNGPQLQARTMIDQAAESIPKNLDVGEKLKLMLARIEATKGLLIGERASLVEAARAKFF